MRLCFEGDRFHLAGGQAVALRDKKGAHVEVLGGDLWVTQEGDRRDLIVANGEAFEVERGGLTVLHALTPAQIQVEETRGTPVRAGGWWKGLRRRAMRHLTGLGKQRAARTQGHWP